jgi:NADH-quinone oxidoreductase subunit G
VLLYSDRCIMCTRCVRFTREITGSNELAVFGRGHKEEIDIFRGKPVNNPLSANVIDLCPVGALLDKDFLFTQRVWFLKTTPSISPLTSGGENIEIHHTDGRIYRIKPRYNKDVNGWWISDETRYGFEFVHDANRLRAPTRLEMGSPVEISWKAAYKQVQDDLRAAVKQHGPGSTAVIVSPFDATEEIYLQIKFARSIDPQAWLVVSPVRMAGEDQVFKNPTTKQVTFTIKAEKAPNRKGAEKMVAHFGGNTCALGDLAAKKPRAVLFASDPLPPANEGQIKAALEAAPVVIRLGTRPCEGNATLTLPTVTWAEKSGVYENFEARVQPFAQAIPPLEDSRSTGQIFWDLLGHPGRYMPASVRATLATAGLAEYANLAEPTSAVKVEEMEFAEL